MLNLSRLKKEEILWLYKHYCRHGHRYIEHLNCLEQEKPITSLIERVGFLDIETVGLNANFDYIISYAILDREKNKILGRVLTPKEVLKYNLLDKDLMFEFCRDIRQFDRIVVYFGCLTAGHRILTADLTWKPVEEIKVGDELIGFDETAEKGKRRKFRKCIVEANEPFIEECYALELSDGTILKASYNHPFLIKNAQEYYTWVTPEYLYKKFTKGKHYKDNWFRRVFKVWETPNNSDYDLGYLAGILDGEGNIHQRSYPNRWGKCSLSISITQSSGIILEKIKMLLDKYGFRYGIFTDKKTKTHVKRIRILGGLGEYLRFLGLVKPEKLKYQFDVNKIGYTKGLHLIPDDTKLVSIKPIGKQIVYGLSTTTKTYIAEGFLCHNSNRRHDIPFLRSRCIKAGAEFPLYGEVNLTDLYDICKNKLRLDGYRLGNVCDFLGIPAKQHPLKGDVWQQAKLGDKKALDYVWKHNVEDVISMSKVYEIMQKYARQPKVSI